MARGRPNKANGKVPPQNINDTSIHFPGARSRRPLPAALLGFYAVFTDGWKVRQTPLVTRHKPNYTLIHKTNRSKAIPLQLKQPLRDEKAHLYKVGSIG
jgi:hypothetical protein